MANANNNTPFLYVEEALAILNISPNDLTFKNTEAAYTKVLEEFCSNRRQQFFTTIMRYIQAAYELLITQNNINKLDFIFFNSFIFFGGTNVGSTIYSHIYDKLAILIPNIENLKVGDRQISKADNCIELHLSMLHEEKGDQRQVKTVSLHCEPVNDFLKGFCCDPYVIIKIYINEKSAEVLRNEDFYTMRSVYPVQTTSGLQLKIILNTFLNAWLRNCILQGYKSFNKKEIN